MWGGVISVFLTLILQAKPINRIKPSITLFRIFSVFLQNPDKQHTGTEVRALAKAGAGTVFPLLQDMCDKDWVTDEWEIQDPKILGRPRKRFFKLTSLGERSMKMFIQDTIPGITIEGCHVNA